MWRWKTSNLKQLAAEKIRQQLHTYFPAPPKLQPYGAILICLLLLLLLRVTTLWVLWNSPNSFCWNFPQLFAAHLLMLHYLCWLYVVIIAILHITIDFGAKCSKWFDKQKILYMVVTRTATVLLNNDVTPILKLATNRCPDNIASQTIPSLIPDFASVPGHFSDSCQIRWHFWVLKRYGDIVEENSSVFSLIQMRWLPSARACWQ